jgi:hypothetical protein
VFCSITILSFNHASPKTHLTKNADLVVPVLDDPISFHFSPYCSRQLKLCKALPTRTTATKQIVLLIELRIP